MHIHIFYILFLSCLSTYCSSNESVTHKSWVDAVKSKKKLTGASPAKSTHALNMHEVKSNAIPHAIPAPITPELPKESILEVIRKGYAALNSGKSASTIFDTVVPILSMQASAYEKSHAFHIAAQAYANEGKIPGELICLSNELAVNYNEGNFWIYDNKSVFPAHNIPATHRMCELFATGHIDTFKEIYLEKNNSKSKDLVDEFTDLVIRTAHASGSTHATLVLARSAAQENNFSRAVELYSMLPDDYTQDISSEKIAVQLIHAHATGGKSELLLSKLSTEEMRKNVIQILESKEQPEIICAVLEHTVRTSSGSEQAQAAFRLYKQLQNISPARADEYLAIAVTEKHREACDIIFEYGKNESDSDIALIFFEQAAAGGNAEAMLACGKHYKQMLETKSTDPADVPSITDRAHHYLVQAIKAGSTKAHLLLATMPNTSTGMLEKLKKCYLDTSLPVLIRGEAYYTAAFVHNRCADNCANTPEGMRKRVADIKKAEALAQCAIRHGYEIAQVFYASCLLDRAICTRQKNERVQLLADAKKRFSEALSSEVNRPQALCGLGRVHMLENNVKAAQECYIEAYSLAPHHSYVQDAITNMLNKMRKEKKYKHINAFTSELIKANPSCHFAYLYQGFVAQDSGNEHDARTYFELASNNGSIEGTQNLGIMYFKNAHSNNDYEKAANCFETVFKADPRNSQAMWWLGKSYHALGRFDEAASQFSLGNDYDDPACKLALAEYIHRGYHAITDLTVARLLYTQAGELYKSQNNIAHSELCNHMATAVLVQNLLHISHQEGNSAKEKAHSVTIQRLEKIINSSILPAQACDEARYTVALANQYFAESISDPQEKKGTLLSALGQLNQIKNKQHFDALFLRAEIMKELATKNLLNEHNPIERIYLNLVEPFYSKLIFDMQDMSPAHKFVKACNSFGTYLIDYAHKPDEAAKYFRMAADRGCVQAMIHLYMHNKVNEQWLAATTWLGKARATTPNSEEVNNLLEAALVNEGAYMPSSAEGVRAPIFASSSIL